MMTQFVKMQIYKIFSFYLQIWKKVCSKLPDFNFFPIFAKTILGNGFASDENRIP